MKDEHEMDESLSRMTAELEQMRTSDPAKFLELIKAINTSIDDIKKSATDA